MQREASYFLLFGTIILFILMLLGASYWMLLPRDSLPVSIGRVDAYPPSERPYRIDEIDGWVVNIDGELLVFHGVATYQWEGSEHGTPCLYAWNEPNMRFEDPCWGSKYWLNGTVVESPATRDLDRYAFRVRGGEILVDTSTVELGTCRVLPERDPYRLNVWEETEPPPICEQDK